MNIHINNYMDAKITIDEHYYSYSYEHFFEDSFKYSRDGILRERREHARGRILADCGRICGSPKCGKHYLQS